MSDPRCGFTFGRTGIEQGGGSFGLDQLIDSYQS